MGTLATLPENLKFKRGDLITADRLNAISEYYNSVTFYDSGNIDADSITIYMRSYDEPVTVAEFHGNSSRVMNPFPWMKVYVDQWVWDADENRYKWKNLVDEGGSLGGYIPWDIQIGLPANAEGFFQLGFTVDDYNPNWLLMEAWMKITNACLPIDNRKGDYIVYMNYPSSDNPLGSQAGTLLTPDILNTGRCMTVPYIEVNNG